MSDGAASEPLLLGRQPILDRNGGMHGFELLFRSSDPARAAHDDLVATSSVLVHAFAELGLERVIGRYRAFVNCDARMLLLPGVVEALPRDRVVVEVLETVVPTPEVIARLRDLKSAGYRLALDDYAPGAPNAGALLPLVDVVKVDLPNTGRAGIGGVVASLRGFEGDLLAEKVETREQADECRALGFALFQGYFFARPSIIVGRKLTLSQATLLRVLALLLEDAETRDVVEELKRQPGLAVNLLKLANSAANAPRAPVSSLLQAVTAMGRRHLQRWVQLLLYTDPARAQLATPLLNTAATRGRLMEMLAQRAWPGSAERAEQAFLIGMLSLTPSLLGVPLEEILAGLPLDPDVVRALSGSEGPLGTLLATVMAAEASERAPADMGLDARAWSAMLLDAMGWANGLG